MENTKAVIKRASITIEKNNVKKVQKTNIKFLIRAITIPIIILIIWQLAGVFGLVSKTVLPTPLDIFLAFQELIKTGELFGHLSISVFRAAAGFFIGGSLGIILGTIVGFSTRSEQYLDPSVQMLRTVPHLAVAPLFVLWFGFGETSKVLLIADGAFFPLYVNAFLGIRGVDSKLFDVARVLEFSKRKLITKLILPAALPNLLLGARLSLGVAWVSLVVAELMGSTEGIGYMIMDARQFSNTDIVFVGIIIFAFVGKFSDSLVRLLEVKFLRWRDNFKGETGN
ncbi:TPA: ABC transporter permease [Bacillus cereus]|uniref:Binding--dependent transport system inner membrane component family protein n=3 Tax=Bacillus cereus TaxID=1396 RepID=A0AAN0STP2_BACCE|nr:MULTISPECIES: ABC transporter permease [Bacillus cereus group]MRD06702.1 ABC transporter permease subunit [Bacillus thuringiensis]ACO29040.1 putative sulfonate ABC transporter, permease protein [Bacillus cereus 03BB102]AJG53350.1 binding--dependent transport system inner membrane component family protein [Bacillus cereus 03BB102]AJI10225.1 binding--dependent transport system inner membrane component family protein [Bacillus cereus 03BB108]EDX64500.1 putative sulfonate ABC transporter, perme